MVDIEVRTGVKGICLVLYEDNNLVWEKTRLFHSFVKKIE